MVAQVAEIIDVQTYDLQQTLNVFHYVDTAGTAVLTDLVDAYQENAIPLMIALQHSGLSHTAIRYRDVFPTATLMQERAITPAITGTEGGEGLASFFAASAKWALPDPTVNLIGGTLPHIRRGGVRVGGQAESQVGNLDYISDFVTAFALWVATLIDPVGDGSWQLAVVSFLGGGSPRPRESTATQYALVGGASAPSPSTQSTRKILRGRAS